MVEKECLYCKSEIPVSAKKCRHCSEFQTERKITPVSPAIIISLIELLGKVIIPITIATVFLLFKPSIDSLIYKTEEAELLGGKFKFNNSKVFNGSLSALEIYFLIASKTNVQTRYNYEYLQKTRPEKLRALENLAMKGLITFKVYDTPEGTTNLSKQTLEMLPTEKGLSLLRELELSF